MKKKFDFDWCQINVDTGISLSGGVMLEFINKSDGNGNKLDYIQSFVNELDNYQAFQLAMAILDSVEVEDSRGSH